MTLACYNSLAHNGPNPVEYVYGYLILKYHNARARARHSHAYCRRAGYPVRRLHECNRLNP